MAGINSKEVGALLIYPEYWAECERVSPELCTPIVDTYVTVTNDKSSPINAHVEVIGDEVCDDCSFDLRLTGFQTRRLRLTRELVGGSEATVIYDASPNSYTGFPTIRAACPEPHGFVVVSLEAPFEEPRRTLGENMLHGDEVVVNLSTGSASQVGAIAVQGVGVNDGNRKFRFDNMEYAAFPSIVTANFWADTDDPGGPARVTPSLILFNANFETGKPPTTFCKLNYVDANERVFNVNFDFDCWVHTRLVDIAPGFHESILGTANGFLWAQCDAGTHGALLTTLGGPTPNYPYPKDADFKDTLFQSTTTNATAMLQLTPSITGPPPAVP